MPDFLNIFLEKEVSNNKIAFHHFSRKTCSFLKITHNKKIFYERKIFQEEKKVKLNRCVISNTFKTSGAAFGWRLNSITLVLYSLKFTSHHHQFIFYLRKYFILVYYFKVWPKGTRWVGWQINCSAVATTNSFIYEYISFWFTSPKVWLKGKGD